MTRISEEDLRTLVRAAIARQAPIHRPGQAGQAGEDRPERHASHVLLEVAPGSEGDGACLIELAVRCTHCGYCQSYGH